MKRATLLVMFLVLALDLAPLALRASNPNPPGQITYQGFLTDANGIPLATNKPVNYTVIFQIYNAATGTGTNVALWGESQVVTVNQGYFSVLLGQGIALATPGAPAWNSDLTALFTGPTASDRFLGMTVIGLASPDSEIAPRLRLLATPYSLSSANAINVTGTNAANVGSLAASGSITASNFVGFGTIPIGGIIMWSGISAPLGWAICDGTQGTPNLSGRFVLGASSGHANGTSGGFESSIITANQMPSHTHDISFNTVGYSASYNSSPEATGAPYNGRNSGTQVRTSVATGGGQPFTIMPPYYALAYIMRIR